MTNPIRELTRYEPDPEMVECSECEYVGPPDVAEDHVCWVDRGAS